VVLGGLAELFSGAISMGLGAYLTADTDREKYMAEEKREYDEVHRFPNSERQEIYDILEKYDIPHDDITPVVNALVKNEDQWVRVCVSHRDIRAKLTRLVHDGFRAPAHKAHQEARLCLCGYHGMFLLHWYTLLRP